MPTRFAFGMTRTQKSRDCVRFSSCEFYAADAASITSTTGPMTQTTMAIMGMGLENAAQRGIEDGQTERIHLQGLRQAGMLLDPR